jgi:hypothetical protein
MFIKYYYPMFLAPFIVLVATAVCGLVGMYSPNNFTVLYKCDNDNQLKNNTEYIRVESIMPSTISDDYKIAEISVCVKLKYSWDGARYAIDDYMKDNNVTYYLVMDND